MSKVLIIYSTTDGQTRKIAERVQRVIERHGHRVTIVSVRDEPDIDLQAFDIVVLGASIRYGTHGKHVRTFIEKNERALRERVSAFFSVNLVARNPQKRGPEANSYVQRFLQQSPWRPQTIAVFAGKLDYPRYGSFDRIMIQLIMRMTKGPADPKTVIEYTDWAQVDEFAQRLAQAGEVAPTRPS